MKRKLLSVVLALCMVLTLMAAPVAAAYQDTEGHWAESSIERWTGHGIVQGTENGFDPDGELTCAQLAAILARLLKLPEAPDAGFSDNPAEAWYYDSVNRCAAAGILLGNGDGTVTPNAPITRERAIVMLSRALGIEPIENPDLSAFEDADAVADYAQGYVAALVAAGVIKGVTDELVGPQLNITRAATVAILDRAIAVYADTDGAEIDASEGGFILVAAENVAIKNAPAGTKVLVTPSADGLTVNGKKVEIDQTYVVPKNKPVTPTVPTHSHSYDEMTHKCSCGSFDPAVVATIGDEVGYLTLKDAVAAVEDGGTIKLVKDAVGSSIGTYRTPKDADANGEPQIAAKGFTIDFDGHTYTIKNPASGSEGYESQGFHLEKTNSGIPDITFRNGKIAVDAENGKDVTMLIQNYCNLSLIDMVIDGSNLNDAYYLINNEKVLGSNYTLSNNSSDGAKTLIQNTEIIARSGEKNVAFDSDKKSNVTVKGNSIIRGKIEVGKNASLVIFGGTYTVEPTEGWIAEGYTAAKSDTEDVWTVTEAENASFAAEVGGVKYTTLAKAIAAAADGDTVTLVDDTDISAAGLNIQKNMTIDLKGHTIKAATARVGNIRVSNAKLVLMDSTDTDKNGTGKGKIIAATDYVYGVSDLPVIYVEDGELVMESGYVETVTENPTANGQFALGVYNTNASASITINGGHIKAGWYCVSGNGGNATYEGEIIINSGILESVADYALYLPHKGTTTINGGTIYGAAGGVTIMRGTLKVNGGTITSKGTGSTGTWGDGTGGLEAAAVNVEAKYGTSTVEIAGGTFIAETKALFIKNSENDGSISITGGTFSSDPSAYVAAGYKATENVTWTVEKITAEEAAAGIGDVYYLTLADAVAAAAAGDTVTLVDDVTLDSLLRIEKNITLDLGGKTLEREGSVLDIYGTVTIQNGTIGTTSTGSTSAAWVNGAAKLTVASDVTFTTTKEAFALAFDSSCTAAEVIFRGTIKGGNGITMNGLIAESAANILTMDGATINVTGHGIYQAGCADTAFTIGNSTISGATGIEVRAGVLNVTNSVISGSGEFNSEANAGGTTTDGAGIAVVQHTTNLPIKVTISGGEISGTYAFYQATKQSQNTAESIAKITLSVTGGEFNGTVYSENKTGFITGGTFSSDPSAYVAEGCAATENDDGTWTVA